MQIITGKECSVALQSWERANLGLENQGSPKFQDKAVPDTLGLEDTIVHLEGFLFISLATPSVSEPSGSKSESGSGEGCPE